jgi:four helix bundle protein
MIRRRFEELPVWQSAIRLAEGVFDLSESAALTGKPGLRDQIERAVLSVSNNIAEGWERGTHEELLTFLYYARGSCGEVRSMLRFLRRRTSSGLGEEVEPLVEMALETSRQLGAWLESLKDSDSRGPRYRTASTRHDEEQSRRQAEFLEKLKRIQEDAKRHPDPPEP